MNRRQIIVGAARLFIAERDEVTGEPTPLPGFETGGTGFVAGESFVDALAEEDSGWRDLGYTQGGVEVTYAPDYGAVEVDQLLDDAFLFKQRQTVTVGTTLAEATLENLLIAWGQTTDTLDSTDPNGTQTLEISAGELGDEPVERSLAFVGKATPRADKGTRERIYHLENVLAVESVSTSLSRAEATTIPVSFRCLPSDNGLYGRIINRVIGTAGGGGGEGEGE
jgi:hypothetical protein